MASSKRPYVAVRLGLFSDALKAGVSAKSTLILALILTHKTKRSVPGLLQLGVAGLAESLGMPQAATKSAVEELQAANLLLVDTREHLLFVVGAVEVDGPKTPNALRSMAAQIRDMPPASPVTAAVRQAVVAAIPSGDKTTEWHAIFEEIAGPSERARPVENASDAASDVSPDKPSGASSDAPSESPYARVRDLQSAIRDPQSANSRPQAGVPLSADPQAADPLSADPQAAGRSEAGMRTSVVRDGSGDKEKPWPQNRGHHSPNNSLNGSSPERLATIAEETLRQHDPHSSIEHLADVYGQIAKDAGVKCTRTQAREHLRVALAERGLHPPTP